MAQTIEPAIGSSRQEAYTSLIPQIQALISAESSPIANMANTAAVLKSAFNFWWVGFYLVDGDELVLGPFQGPVACTRIAKGKGVCGEAWQQSSVIRVDDVDQFPGHIACSSASRSEIVVPIVHQGEVKAVLDIDSDKLADFSQEDETALTALAKILANILYLDAC
ncbi:MAG: GAF domain-containing protein [Cellvibrionaceae bacterium]